MELFFFPLFCHFNDTVGGWGDEAVFTSPSWITSLGGTLIGWEKALMGEQQPKQRQGCGKSLPTVIAICLSLLLRWTLGSSWALSSSSCRNFSLRTQEATSPASTCKYHRASATVAPDSCVGPALRSREQKAWFCWQSNLAGALQDFLLIKVPSKYSLPPPVLQPPRELLIHTVVTQEGKESHTREITLGIARFARGVS